MKAVNTQDAKTNLSRLINDAFSGEEIVITRHNLPVARISAYCESATERKIGVCPELIVCMGDDFNEPGEEFDDYDIDRRW